MKRKEKGGKKVRKMILKRILTFAVCVVLFVMTFLISSENVQAEDIHKLQYNEANISAIGTQGKNQCMAYALSYCRTIIDGYTHSGTEYWQTGVGGMYGKANYTTSGASSKQALLKIVYDQINAGLPVCMYVTGRYRQNQNYSAPGDHWVAVVGYRASADPNNLKISDFYILDPAGCNYDFLYDNDSCIRCNSYALRISNAGASIVSPYESVYVDNISDTNAKINAKLTYTRYLTSIGFYISKNFDMSNSTKITENVNMNVLSIWYDMNKWYGVLEEGTTYYYQFFITSNGSEIKGDIQSFTTTGDSQPPTITNVQTTDVTRDGYTVTCEATDDTGVTHVDFPTWTEFNGQDDLANPWPSVANNGVNNTYTFRVNVSDHNYESGAYHTHIYAHDAAGNQTVYGLDIVINRDIALESFTISNSAIALDINQTQKLSVLTYNPSNTTADKTATWTSSDTAVASVDAQGNVTGLDKGTAVITCTVAGKTQTCTVTVSDVVLQEFSGWVESLPSEVSNNAGLYEIQQKTQYRSSTKSETTSTDANLSGWTKSNEWWGDWQPCGSNVTGTATREVRQEQQYVKTQYKYNHWHNGNYLSPVQYSGYVYHETGWLDSPLTAGGTSSAGGTKYKSSISIGSCGTTTWWYNQTTQDVYNTLYYYRDKYFQYYQWSGWSDWSDNAVTASDTVNVETRTIYRYRYIGPSITTQPSNQVVEENATTAFTVEANGRNLSYQWQVSKDNGQSWSASALTGSKTATMEVLGLEGRNGYQFRCVVTDGNGNSVISSAVELTVLVKMQLLTQPVSQTVETGKTATFTVKARGNNLSYRWQVSKDNGESWSDSAMTGSKTASLKALGADNRDGYQFRCVIKDENGNSIISDAVTLTVIGDAKITGQPTSESVAAGNTAYFEVTAKGLNLTYQWQVSKDGGKTWSASAITGNKTAKLEVLGLDGRDGYQFRCVVTDGKGNSVTSNAVTLTVIGNAKITKQPVSQGLEAGKTAIFSVTASGIDLSYQWQVSKDAGKSWSDSAMTGNKTPSLEVETLEGRNGYQFRCIVKDAKGNSVTSDAVKLTVVGNAKITKQPVSQSVETGKTATFSVTASGVGLTYQWQVSKDAGKNWSDSAMTGNKTASLSVEAVEGRDGYRFRCIVKDTKGNSVTSNAVTLTVIGNAKITKQPVSLSTEEGKTVTFSVTASGVGLTYQWQVSKDAGKSWSDSAMTGNKTANLKVEATEGRDGYQFRCIVKDGKGNSVTSGTAKLTVIGDVKITKQPTSQSVKAGETATFGVTASGAGLTYQWQVSKDAGKTWSDSAMTGNKTASLKVEATAGRDGYRFRCIVKDGKGNSVTSNGAELSVSSEKPQETYFRISSVSGGDLVETEAK